MAETRDRRDFTREEAAAIYDYNPETGVFRWKVRTCPWGGRANIGYPAGALKDGYRELRLFGQRYRRCHIAWFLMTGEWPPAGMDVDHINRNRSDDRWANLRLATRSQNNMNASLRSDNKSGHKGVGRRKDTGKWQARVKVDGRVICLGHFDTMDDAVAVRRDAERKFYGEFAAT